MNLSRDRKFQRREREREREREGERERNGNNTMANKYKKDRQKYNRCEKEDVLTKYDEGGLKK